MIYGRIYQIICGETGLCYYGSTELTIEQRLSNHIRGCRAWKKGKAGYVTAYRIIERGNFSILLLEEGDFENTTAMEARECYYILNNECVNKNIPTRTPRERYEANREQLLERMKEYREVHKETAKEYAKEYNQSNRQRLSEYHKEWWESHREQLQKRRNEKHTCECEGFYTHSNKAQHIKTKKHKNYIKNIIASVVEDIRIHIERDILNQRNTEII